MSSIGSFLAKWLAVWSICRIVQFKRHMQHLVRTRQSFRKQLRTS